MKKLSNPEAELKKSLANKKCNITYTTSIYINMISLF